jgi:phosphoribosylamine--glycine ligase
VVLLRLTTDLAALLASAAAGAIDVEPTYDEGAAVLVVAAAEGYPTAVRTGDPIDGLDAARGVEGATVFSAGVAMGEDGALVTAGGRVLEVVGRGPDLPTARSRAYEAIGHLRWPGAFHRTDIASEVLT